MVSCLRVDLTFPRFLGFVGRIAPSRVLVKILKLRAPLPVAARDGPAGGADLPDAQQPDPVEALFGEAIQRGIIDFSESDRSTSLAGQVPRSQTRALIWNSVG
jgi:hypothetical protein